MTFQPSSRGRPPTRPIPDRDAVAAVDDVAGRLTDSANGLRRAAGLVDDDTLTRFLAGLVERREEARSGLVATAAEAGLQPAEEPDGSLVEQLRRGWMELEAAVDGDEAIIGTAIDEERELLREVDRVLSLGLPDAVLSELRSISGEIGADITSLQEWRHAGGEG